MRKKVIYTSLILLFVSFLNLSAQEIIEVDKNLFKTSSINRQIKTYQNSKVIIRSVSTLSGKITIETGESDIADIRYTKHAKSRSKSEAIDFIDLISVNFEKTKDGVKIDLRAPNPAPWSGTNQSGFIEISLVLPEFCEVEIEATNFDIDAEGPFDKFIIPKTLGRVYVENVIKELRIVSSNRRVAIRDISGEINVATTNSTLTAENINSASHRVELRNEGGDIKVFGIKGELYVKNAYGRIEIIDFDPTGKKNYIRGSNGPITLELLSCDTKQIIVTNKYEDIEIKFPAEIDATLMLAVEEDGKIEVTDLLLKPDLIQNNRLNLVLGNGEKIINSSILGSGNIYMRGYKEGE